MKTTKQYPGMGAVSGRPSATELIARREEFLEQIREMLAKGRVTAIGIAEQLGLSKISAYRYLAILGELGEAHRHWEHDSKGREQWASGRAPLQQEVAKEEIVEVQQPRAMIVPARQIGMWRDPLDTAFFGPAPGVAG